MLLCLDASLSQCFSLPLENERVRSAIVVGYGSGIPRGAINLAVRDRHGWWRVEIAAGSARTCVRIRDRMRNEFVYFLQADRLIRLNCLANALFASHPPRDTSR